MNEPIQQSEAEEEILYNGISLPAEWPPRHLDPKSVQPMPVPYLDQPPEVIPIDVGRQLFVDDFLIEGTTLKRRFHRPWKYEGNPVLTPETELERNDGLCPVACPFGDGVFCDPQDGLFKMWYHAGWFDGTALATSRHGLIWERPSLDVVPGTNRVTPAREDFRRDGVSVWLDHYATDPEERFKMFLYARSDRDGMGGWLLTSPDGIHWQERTSTGPVGDNASLFYNPFRKKWVLSIRSGRRARTRDYREHTDFLGLASWEEHEKVYWCGTDALDVAAPDIGEPPQLYKVEAAPYESLMLGTYLIHHGPHNDVCQAGGFPKTTHVEVVFSRDGFHWHRPNRRFFIPATKREGDWDRNYIHPAVGGCLIVRDKLYFYYGGWSGESPALGGDMYAGGSTGLAVLRRDGFASMEADASGGVLTTRPLTFRGKCLFVNLDALQGELRVEVVDGDGKSIAPFGVDSCVPLCADDTCQLVKWGPGDDLSALAGQPVRLRFHLRNASLYAFWVSPESSGASFGYVAGGGPGFTGPIDTVGRDKCR